MCTIKLSQAQRRAIIAIARMGALKKHDESDFYFSGEAGLACRGATVRALLDKELIHWSESESGWILSKAGEAQAELLGCRLTLVGGRTRKSLQYNLSQSEMDSALSPSVPIFLVRS